jgi:hypothetical protein
VIRRIRKIEVPSQPGEKSSWDPFSTYKLGTVEQTSHTSYTGVINKIIMVKASRPINVRPYSEIS